MRHTIFLISLLFICCSGVSAQQATELWTSNQLLEPATLASNITKGETKNLLIVSVGPDATIKGSVEMGPAHDEANLKRLEIYLKNVSKDKEVVIYCGCCPFAKCPNIRPAFKLLTDMGFKNAKLLSLPKNIKADWLDKNYPTND
ncbi:MAG: rhodanese-like domain-containing protein [Ferruginibacter sp.]